MATFEYSIEIHADRYKLFYLTQDYQRRLEWDPFLKQAILKDGAIKADIGVRAWCVAKNGLAMETEYISFEPPVAAAVKMTKGPIILSSFAGSWRFDEISSEITKVTFRYHLKAWPLWLNLILNPILQHVFSRDTVNRLIALKRAVETTDILDRLPAI
ncbi:MAG: SRPBCC family protein [Acidobacteriota bacterium]